MLGPIGANILAVLSLCRVAWLQSVAENDGLHVVSGAPFGQHTVQIAVGANLDSVHRVLTGLVDTLKRLVVGPFHYSQI